MPGRVAVHECRTGSPRPTGSSGGCIAMAGFAPVPPTRSIDIGITRSRPPADEKRDRRRPASWPSTNDVFRWRVMRPLLSAASDSVKVTDQLDQRLGEPDGV